jgi:uncharacterized protein YcnI
MQRAQKRTMIGVAVGVALAGAIGSAASAHVTIDTLGDVEAGGFSKLGFSVPNERDDSGTVELTVQMPADQPLVFVSVQPKTGWEVETTMRALDEPVEAFGSSFDEVVDTVTWTASEGTVIGPGQFEEFWVSAGPMPTGVDTLEFPALQTYEDGEVVRWIEPTPPGGEEPEHPAPAVALVAATEAATDAEATSTSGEDDDSDSSTTLSVIALVVGALGLIVGGVALVTSRKRAPAG